MRTNSDEIKDLLLLHENSPMKIFLVGDGSLFVLYVTKTNSEYEVKEYCKRNEVKVYENTLFKGTIKACINFAKNRKEFLNDMGISEFRNQT